MSGADVAFDSWLGAVDRIVNERTGVSVHDLPDMPFRDWFDDGVSAKQAAARAILSANDEE